MTVSFETNCINGSVNNVDSEQIPQLGSWIPLGDINDLAAKRSRLVQSLRYQITNHDHRSPEQLRRIRGSQTHRSCSRYVHR